MGFSIGSSGSDDGGDTDDDGDGDDGDESDDDDDDDENVNCRKNFRKTFLDLLSCNALRRLCGKDKFDY